MSPHPRDGRDAILGRVRRALGVGAEDAERRVAIQKRLYDHVRNLVPARTKGSADNLIKQFKEMLESQSAKVSEVGTADEIPELIAKELRDNNLPSRLRMGDDGFLVEIDWDRAPTLEIERGRSDGHDPVGLSHALVGVSETGTLILISGADNPTTLNFLPETHIVVVRAEDIVGPYEDVWERLRETYGERAMPRAVNMIAGPSRTGDIEQTIVMGAHGPRRVHVIVVEE